MPTDKPNTERPARIELREGYYMKQTGDDICPWAIVAPTGTSFKTMLGQLDHFEEVEAFAAAMAPQDGLSAALEVVKKAKALKNYLFKSLNAGPLTNDPSREAKVLRELYQAIEAYDGLAATPAAQQAAAEEV